MTPEPEPQLDLRDAAPAVIVDLGKGVVLREAGCLMALAHGLDEGFVAAVDAIKTCKGHVITVGIGKSGHVAAKIAATLSSTGTPAAFVNAGEAAHGDLGAITSRDVVVAVTHSGETPEVLRLLPRISAVEAPLIAIVGHPASTLGAAADAVLPTLVDIEADPLNMAPTCSTTAAMALGDALAVAVAARRGGLSLDEFTARHPGGMLGGRTEPL
jgi:arabinose-5-phosphate isomerase